MATPLKIGAAVVSLLVLMVTGWLLGRPLTMGMASMPGTCASMSYLETVGFNLDRISMVRPLSIKAARVSLLVLMVTGWLLGRPGTMGLVPVPGTYASTGYLKADGSNLDRISMARPLSIKAARVSLLVLMVTGWLLGRPLTMGMASMPGTCASTG